MERLVHTFGPFVWDGRIGCPTAEQMAQDSLAKDHAHAESLRGKLAIVTGCTVGGIGAYTAKILAGKVGMQVICAGRNQGKMNDCVQWILDDFPDAQVFPYTLDVSSLASVEEFVKNFESEFPADRFHLTLLVNNAGIMAPPYRTSVDGIESQMATNHVGPFHLTNLLLPRLIKAQPSRIINVASCAHAIPPTFDPKMHLSFDYTSERAGPYRAYGRSKRANILFAMELNERYSPSGVTAYSLHPGNIKSNLGQHNFAAWLAYEAIPCVHKNVSQGASTTLYCALQPNIEHQAGAYFVARKPSHAVGCDKETARELWEETETLIKKVGK